MKKTIEFLELNGITDYVIQGDRLVINGDVFLDQISNIPDNVLFQNCDIVGTLYLNSVIYLPKNFLNNSNISCALYLSFIENVHDNFLCNVKIGSRLDLSSITNISNISNNFLTNTVIGTCLNLNSLTTVHKHLLKYTTIGGLLFLRSLNNTDKIILNNNYVKLEEGYNYEKSYIYCNGVLSHVISSKTVGEYTLYKTVQGYIIDVDGYYIHTDLFKKVKKYVDLKDLSKKIKYEKLN